MIASNPVDPNGRDLLAWEPEALLILKVSRDAFRGGATLDYGSPVEKNRMTAKRGNSIQLMRHHHHGYLKKPST